MLKSEVDNLIHDLFLAKNSYITIPNEKCNLIFDT
jgi:hypothetical protein